MKKSLLTLIISLTICVTARSQSLQFSTFAIYIPPNTLFAYFHFNADTLFASPDNITYFPSSHYEVSNDTMVIYDFTTLAGCQLTDTGMYTFTIQNDTLEFTLISDPCAARSSILDPYFGVLLNTGIVTQSQSSSIRIFPNPSADGIFNLSISDNFEGFDKISVSTLQGKIILEEAVAEYGNIEKTVMIQNFPPGMYLLTLQSSSGNKIFKLIK